VRDIKKKNKEINIILSIKLEKDLPTDSKSTLIAFHIDLPSLCFSDTAQRIYKKIDKNFGQFQKDGLLKVSAISMSCRAQFTGKELEDYLEDVCDR
jgi:hypothetical protein